MTTIKPNPFSEPFEEVTLNLKDVATLLMNTHKLIGLANISENKGTPIDDLISIYFPRDDERLFGDCNYYSKIIVGYLGDIIDYFTNNDKYVSLFDVVTNEENASIGSFIKKWCLPSGDINDTDYITFRKNIIGSSIPKEASQVLRLLKYDEFLKTLYWKAISTHIKEGAKCEICGATDNLHVHHKTYDNHGYEHLHLEDLQCLCKDCHLKTHHELNKKK